MTGSDLKRTNNGCSWISFIKVLCFSKFKKQRKSLILFYYLKSVHQAMITSKCINLYALFILNSYKEVIRNLRFKINK